MVRTRFVGLRSIFPILNGDAASRCHDVESQLSIDNCVSLFPVWHGSLTGWKYIVSSEFFFRFLVVGEKSPLPSSKHFPSTWSVISSLCGGRANSFPKRQSVGDTVVIYGKGLIGHHHVLLGLIVRGILYGGTITSVKEKDFL